MTENAGTSKGLSRAVLWVRGNGTGIYGRVLPLVISLLALPIVTSGFRTTVCCTTFPCANAPDVATNGAQSVHHHQGVPVALKLRWSPGRHPALRRRLLYARSHDVDVDAVESCRGANVPIRIPQFYTDEYLHDIERLRENGNLDGSPSTSGYAAASVVPPYPSPLHHIHVVPLLSHDEAATCLRMATQYASETKCWDRPDFQRHESYATCDFCVDDCGELLKYLGRVGFERRIVEEIAARYQVDGADLEFLDLFCAHYVAKTPDAADPTTHVMDRLEPHRDGSVMSFTVLLSPPSDFEGGGTFFDALRDEPKDDDMCLHEWGVVRPKFAGDAVLHSGKLLHGADAVTRGSRTVLVGFVSADRWQRPGALAAACRDWGRMDVARWRCNRHQRKGGPEGKGWYRSIANRMWLPKQQGRSDIRSYCPNFESVWRRADPEFQRWYKLRAEDLLLRRILLDTPSDLPSGPVTVDAFPAFDDVTVL